MNKTQIEKSIKLLNESKLDELKQLLMFELLKEDKNKNVKIVDIVKKYLKEAKNFGNRPMLETVMQKDGKQFICNGFNLIVFEEYLNELDILPQTTEDAINYKQILCSGLDYKTLTANEIDKINDIDNYLKFLKLQHKEQENRPIMLFNYVYDANYIKLFKSVFSDLSKVKYGIGRIGTLQATDGKVTFLQLPLRIFEDEAKQNIETIYNEFLSNKGV